MIKLRDILYERITKSDLDAVEQYADKLFRNVGIDINFTQHFLARVNHARNKRQITPKELQHLFQQTYRKYGRSIPKLGDRAQAVIHDMENDVNVPFILNWDERSKEFDLISKTVMRKKNFKTHTKKMDV